MHVPERGEEGLLDRIVGLVAIRDHPGDEREEVILVALHEVVERGEVTAARALEQDEVAALDRVFDHLVRAKVVHGAGGPPDGDGEARGV
jgi:hypothetical protein